MTTLEFFFDTSSPWTYLAFTRIQPIAQRTKTEIDWRPILVGGVFNAVNRDVYERRANPDPRKAAYSNKDLKDWARLAGIKIDWPPVFPVRATLVMRAVLVAQEKGKVVEFARAAFESYWGALEDVSQASVVAKIARSCGLNPDTVLERAGQDEIKTRLRANTDELIARGGFGSPTLFVNRTDMYFGNDRLPLVEAALERLTNDA